MRNLIEKIKSNSHFFIALLFLVLIYIINFFFLHSLHSLKWGESIGFINLFYNVVMTFNTFIFMLVPIISVVANGEGKLIHCNKASKSTIYEFFHTVKGGLVFLVAQVLILLFFIICDPSISQPVNVIGIFTDIYYASPILYILIYIIHSFVCGWILSFFGRSIYLLTNSKYYSLIIVFIIYRIQNYIPSNWSGVINLLPFHPFEFSSIGFSLFKNSYDLILILLVSAFLILKKYECMQKSVPNDNNV